MLCEENIIYKLLLCCFLMLLLFGCETIILDGEEVKNPPKHVHVSVEYIGMNEYNDRVAIKNYVGVDPKHYEWCAAFLNAVLQESNMENLHDTNHQAPLLARSFLDWGISVDIPMAGDIVVFPRGNSEWKGHVGLYLNTVYKNGKEYYRILGGNQNNAVSIDLYLAKKALGIRRANKY